MFFVCFLILTINLKSPFAAKELKKFWKEHSLLLPQHLSHLCPQHDWPPQAPISLVGLELLTLSSLPDSTLVPSLGPQSDLSVARIPLHPFPVFPSSLGLMSSSSPGKEQPQTPPRVWPCLASQPLPFTHPAHLQNHPQVLTCHAVLLCELGMSCSHFVHPGNPCICFRSQLQEK